MVKGVGFMSRQTDTMASALKGMGLALAGLALAGCGQMMDRQTWDPASVTNLPVPDEPYAAALVAEYVRIARVERAEQDWRDSAFFLDKARAAATGGVPASQPSEDRDLSPDVAETLTAAREELLGVSTIKAEIFAPEALAKAQASYDCWLQEQEEGFQDEDIAACRTDFETALQEVKDILAEPKDLFVVLPHEDGSVGGIEIDDGSSTVVLDTPLAASVVRGGGSVSVDLTSEQVETIFGDALAGLPEPPQSYTLYFQEGTTDLMADSEPVLATMLAEVKRRAAPEVEIIGHTDRVGATGFNDRLAKRRAEAVRASLEGKLGLPERSVSTAGRGERAPLIPTPDGVEEPRNRRVEVTIR
jgi:OOP family OmpA-OmpF porin